MLRHTGLNQVLPAGTGLTQTVIQSNITGNNRIGLLKHITISQVDFTGTTNDAIMAIFTNEHISLPTNEVNFKEKVAVNGIDITQSYAIVTSGAVFNKTTQISFPEGIKFNTNLLYAIFRPSSVAISVLIKCYYEILKVSEHEYLLMTSKIQ